MALKFSTGLKNQLFNAIRGAVSSTYSLADGVIYIYSGSQPATADAAVTGTLLAKVTKSAGTYTWGAYQTSDADGICYSTEASRD